VISSAAKVAFTVATEKWNPPCHPEEEAKRSYRSGSLNQVYNTYVMTRDDKWLHQLLDSTWDAHFSDVPQNNIVKIRWGRRAKNRLGSIMLDPKDRDISIITLNSLFKDPEIPEFVIKATLVHELCHYAHGFNSPSDQKYQHPHAGGVIKREYAERGLLELYLEQRRWLKFNWRGVVEKKLPKRVSTTKRAVKNTISVPKPFWFVG
jgi:hypothetical protein